MEAVEQRAHQRTIKSLSEKVIASGLWVLALRIVNRGLGLIRTLVLARLLAPEDFGLLGIAMLSISTLETFSQTGVEAALIQKKENVYSYLDTAWTVSVIRGFTLFSILFLLAPTIAIFFNSPRATFVIRVIAISTLLTGCRNIGVIFFQKELEFNKQFSYEISATLVDLTVAITLAFLLKNVWALVWGGMAANLTRLFMSYRIHSYRPKVRIHKEEFLELISFGKWILGSGILVFLITKGDDIFVGKILGITALGFYQMAYLISNLPATEITHAISKVTFPAYSKLQDDISQLKDGYFKVLEITVFLSIPVAGAIFLLAPDFTEVFLGQKWLPMVSALQVLCFFGVIRSIGATMGPILYGTGRPKVQTKVSAVQLLFLAIVIYPLTISLQILGTSLAVLVSNLLGFILITRETKAILNFRYGEVCTVLAVPLCSYLSVFFLVFLPVTLMSPQRSIILILLILLLTTIIYFIIIYLWDRKRYRILENIRNLPNIFASR